MTLLTEKEAAEKWCPMARYTSMRGQGINRWIEVNNDDEQLNPQPARCIGSRCMAWRVANSGYERNGYCGAFGKVEP